ncbi:MULTISPECIES: hypothetical protein [unclassified Chryseobacterium]|nr:MULTISPECIES: hypothetical protein [unclassified Chryseobacterium]
MEPRPGYEKKKPTEKKSPSEMLTLPLKQALRSLAALMKPMNIARW